MVTLGILVFAVVGTTFVVIIAYLFRAMYRAAQAGEAGFARATMATAKVLEVGQSSASLRHGVAGVELTLEVHPPGGSPFELKTTWAVESGAAEKIQVGRMLAVRIDPKRPKAVYSAEKWAQSLDSVPGASDESNN